MKIFSEEQKQMTVKIVDPNPQKTVIKYKVCPHCGCKLSYAPNDVENIRYRDYDGGSAGQDYIMCAKCKKKIVLRYL